MQAYPTIEKKVLDNMEYYLFEKLDGSNIRVEFSLKNGFERYGSRHRLLDEHSGILNKAISLIEHNKKEITEIFKANKWQSGTLFFEFYGENSFAGFHDADDSFKVVLIDAHIFKKGFLAPEAYLNAFSGRINLPHFIGVQKIDAKSIEQIRKGIFPGMAFEGVIGKAYYKNKVVRCKIKSDEWIGKLKERCKDDLELFERLK